MIALFVSGWSVLHRAPAGAKILGLAIVALGVSFLPRDPLATAVVGGAVVLAYAAAGFFPRRLGAELWRARWVVVFMGVTQLLFLTPLDAVLNTARVLSLVMLAALLALTTRAEALLTALEAGLAPLRHVGVDASRVSLTLSLTISSIPVIGTFAARAREAQQARGVRLGFRFVVPLLVMSLRHADDVGDALAARGMG